MSKIRLSIMLVLFAGMFFTSCEKNEDAIIPLSEVKEVVVEETVEETGDLNLKSSSTSYSTSWMGWTVRCLDVPNGNDRVVVKIYNTNSSNGTVYIRSNYGSCNFSSASPIYTTTPPSQGRTKRIYIPRSFIGNDNKLVFWIDGSNLTGNLYAYDE